MSEELSVLEQIKLDSRFLRGTIIECLEDPLTGAIVDDDTKLLKFHGSYQQDDRDLREERRLQKLEPAYSFMLRVRLPGGVLSAAQWLALQDIAQRYSRGTIKITTRQTIQFHGIPKHSMRPLVQAMEEVLLDSIAACGDVNRNVICAANPHASSLHRAVYEASVGLSEYLRPETNAYNEIFLDGEKVDPSSEQESLYGPTYLPRKFKIALTIPPNNDVDLFAHDLGFIAIVEKGELAGYNVTVGGGMGRTYGDDRTYARVGSVIGFIKPEVINQVAEQVVAIQRDYGNRVDRPLARLKYTVDRVGVDFIIEELNKRLGFEIEAARPFVFDNNGDRYGWVQGEDGLWHLTLYIEAGRVYDEAINAGLREVISAHDGEIRLTTNQNLIIARVSEENKQAISALVEKNGLDSYKRASGIRRNSIACVAFPTCGLAMAESERYLPDILEKLEARLDHYGLLQEPIVFRISGCPNGCSRPFLAEIALTGRAIGRYNLNLGGNFAGERVNTVYRDNITEDEILEVLDGLFASFAKERNKGEHFGDFLYRTGVISA